ncbi:MAG: cytochrome C oxidase subunit IV family protein [Halarcobacter sp.]
MNKSTAIYISLLFLTSLTYFLGQSETFTLPFIILVLITTFVKGQLIIDYFMELRNVTLKYRLFVSIWLFLVISLIGISYFFPVLPSA